MQATSSLLTADTCSNSKLPHKRGLAGVTPVELQLQRGTCWIFASMAMLEHSYRTQGIRSGWLKSTSYLKLSPQAFGIAVLDACRAAPDWCFFPEDEIYTGNSTQGGEYTVLWSLRLLRNTSALPASTCPYVPTTGHDRECPGLYKAQASSPLLFHVRGMRTHYERIAMQHALHDRSQMLALSMPLANVKHLLPCTEATRTAINCDPKSEVTCHACPKQRAYAGVDCCIISERTMNTMAGEFYYLPILPLRREGGHAVTIVGYNDVFVTEAGFTGGWIIKNSWWDGLPPGPSWKQARGSHSMGYFLQEHSDADERSICPNVHSPRSWYSCDDLQTCRDPRTALYAKTVHKVLRLECIDRSPFAKGVCTKGAFYYLQRTAPWGDEPGDMGGGLHTSCFIYDNPAVATTDAPESGGVTRRLSSKADGTICTPPLPLDDLAMIFSPADGEMAPNDPDLCGFYLMPYSVLDTLSVRFGGMFASELDIVWSAQSYAQAATARRDASRYDWRAIERDTLEQRVAEFAGGPFPDIQHPKL